MHGVILRAMQIKHGNASRSADISHLLSKVISKPGYKGDVVLYLRPNALVEAVCSCAGCGTRLGF